MLKKLFIQNYAIINEIEISFHPQLNMITGETGAGKSILMGALSLVLGQRADTSLLLHKNKKCVVEGYFINHKKKPVLQFLKDNDIEVVDELVVRREISASGKSRALINDTLVNLQQLQLFSSLLVDLHQQFDTASLSSTDFQKQVIDALADHATVLQNYQRLFAELKQAQQALTNLQDQKKQFATTYDYHQFLLTELEEANFTPDELENAEAELKLLSNAEGIKSAVNAVGTILNEGEQPMVRQLKLLFHSLQNFAAYHPQLPAIIDRLQSVQIELADIAADLEQVSDQIQYNPERIEWLNERLSTGYKLLKKHHLQHTAELLTVQSSLYEKLQIVLNIEEAIAEQEKKFIALTSAAKEIALTISVNRKKKIPSFQSTVNHLLSQVGMPNAALKVSVVEASELHQTGQDIIDFLFDANKSNKFELVGKVASGGELSRLMLCIKSLVAQSLDLPTLIFDEIDTGISGEAAKQVGIIMQQLASKRQVICITHQPQIAGKADAHFWVYKEDNAHEVTTSIRLLNYDEQVMAIAKMLGGEKPSPAAISNAKEMVGNERKVGKR
jgi:DNA repair protein RecN (Recombination protein N)